MNNFQLDFKMVPKLSDDLTITVGCVLRMTQSIDKHSLLWHTKEVAKWTEVNIRSNLASIFYKDFHKDLLDTKREVMMLPYYNVADLRKADAGINNCIRAVLNGTHLPKVKVEV